MAVPYAPPRWPAVTATTGIWALAAASIVFWGLKLGAPSDAIAPPAVPSTPQAAADPALVAQFLGAVSTQAAVVAIPEAASRFSLLGVIADSDGQGAALLVVDGKPAKPFRVGSTVVDGYVLQSVGTRAASLGAGLDAPTAFTLQLPTRPLAVMSPPNLPAVPPVIAPAGPR